MPAPDAWNGYGCRLEDRVQIWAELTPGQRRWSDQRDACRSRHNHYERMGQMTKHNIATAEGVIEAGPDEPALARAAQAEEVKRAMAMGSAGAVSAAQAGVSVTTDKLQTGRIHVSSAMVERGVRAADDLGRGLVEAEVRTILEAALRY